MWQNVAVHAAVKWLETPQLAVTSYHNGVQDPDRCIIPLTGNRHVTVGLDASWNISFFACDHEFIVYDQHGVLCYMPYNFSPVPNPSDIDTIVFSSDDVPNLFDDTSKFVGVTGMDYAY
jgi:hypothetical protein